MAFKVLINVYGLFVNILKARKYFQNLGIVLKPYEIFIVPFKIFPKP